MLSPFDSVIMNHIAIIINNILVISKLLPAEACVRIKKITSLKAFDGTLLLQFTTKETFSSCLFLNKKMYIDFQ